jgi:hypothetical protein
MGSKKVYYQEEVKGEKRYTKEEWDQKRKNILESDVPTEKLLTQLRSAS